MAGIVATTGILSQAAFVVMVALWSYSGWMAYSTIRNGRVQLHRTWMIRNFALTLAAVWLRIVLLVVTNFFPSVPFEDAYHLAVWSSLLGPLIIVEWFVIQSTLRPRELKQQS